VDKCNRSSARDNNTPHIKRLRIVATVEYHLSDEARVHSLPHPAYRNTSPDRTSPLLFSRYTALPSLSSSSLRRVSTPEAWVSTPS